MSANELERGARYSWRPFLASGAPEKLKSGVFQPLVDRGRKRVYFDIDLARLFYLRNPAEKLRGMSGDQFVREAKIEFRVIGPNNEIIFQNGCLGRLKRRVAEQTRALRLGEGGE